MKGLSQKMCVCIKSHRHRQQCGEGQRESGLVVGGGGQRGGESE